MNENIKNDSLKVVFVKDAHIIGYQAFSDVTKGTNNSIFGSFENKNLDNGDSNE